MKTVYWVKIKAFEAELERREGPSAQSLEEYLIHPPVYTGRTNYHSRAIKLGVGWGTFLTQTRRQEASEPIRGVTKSSETTEKRGARRRPIRGRGPQAEVALAERRKKKYKGKEARTSLASRSF